MGKTTLDLSHYLRNLPRNQTNVFRPGFSRFDSGKAMDLKHRPPRVPPRQERR